MPQYRLTNSFKKDLGGLGEPIKKAAKKAFELFQENPRHPSLKIHPMEGHPKIWEGHITEKYVFTFEKTRADNGELIYWFRRMGDHSIYRKP